MLDDVVHSKVDEAKVSLFVRLHQPLAKVIDSGEALVVVINRKVVAIEDGVPVNKAGHIQARKEPRINLVHLFAEEALEEVEAPTTADIATTLSAVDARL